MPSQPLDLSAFKAYDIRGRVPDQLNEDIAWRIGRGLAGMLQGDSVVIGRDVRLSSEPLSKALARGLNEAGFDVLDIGLCGTEEVYFQSAHRQAAGGVMVTASHNPMDYNGLKLVRDEARPISGDTGLKELATRVASGNFAPPQRRDEPVGARHAGDRAPRPSPTITRDEDKSTYIDHLLGYVDRDQLKPLKIVANPGNGGAGIIIDQLARHLPFEFIRIHHEPDGTFPNGIPNPLLTENRSATQDAVREHGADFGLAWDGDFDRCFFFDHTGRFIEGYYLVGLLAVAALAKHPGGKIIHDPRLTWNTIEMVQQAGGIPVQNKSGHAFIKERMRSEDAIYGGEMSAHHYFRDFYYADSGMIPWLLVAELVSREGRSLADMVEERMRAYPCSGEINFRVDDAAAAVARVMDAVAAGNPTLDHTDGISAEFADWRFNLRSSNTEPLLRLNVESRADAELLRSSTERLSRLIGGTG